MANVRTIQRSFTGGEVSPEMFGRTDDAKYQAGAAKLRNFITKPQGPAENRAGLEFVREVKDSTKQVRLIPFTYSTTQTMVIEMGEGYFRFHTQGASLLAGSPAAYNGGTAYVLGDMCSSGGVNYYCIAATTGNAPPNASYWYAMPANGLYEIPNPYAEADLFDIHHVQSADVLTLVHPGYAPRELRRMGATNWQLSTISFAAPVAAPTGLNVVASGHTSVKYTYRYVVTTIASDQVSESAASTDDSAGGNLLEDGGICTISWSAVSGADRYNVYKLQGGLYGYIGQTAGLSIIDDNITPDMSKTPPLYDASLFAGAGDYPGAVSYYEQRRCFAGTDNSPSNIWMTKSGTEKDMSYRLPVVDDDRIKFRVAAREANTIRHIVPLAQLLLLTSSAEWRVSSVNSDAITPTSISVKPQSYVGASNVQPVIVNNALLYGSARGGHVRELAYNWQANGFITGDLSLRAPHLFDTYDIVDAAYSKAPQPVVWFVSTSGYLLGLTYVPEQNIGAWHWHDTDGTFESCTVVAEGVEDRLYCVVNRTIDGATVRYIERMASRQFADQVDAFFVDCGSTFDGTNTGVTTMTLSGGTDWDDTEQLTLTASVSTFVYPATTDVGDAIILTDDDGVEYTLTIEATSSGTVALVRTDKEIPVALRSTATAVWSFARNTISGLDHIEGKVVNILADGAVHPQRTVTSGAVTLDIPSVVVHVGLPIEADIQTLPVSMQIDNAFGQGRYKNVNKAWIRVYRSSGIFVGPDEDNLVEAKQRTTEPYGSPPTLKSEEIQVMLTPSWGDSGQVYVRQSDPLPLTVVSLTLEVAIGG